jgi:hypothetical protein
LCSHPVTIGGYNNIRGYITPLFLRSSLSSYLAFYGLANDQEKILRSTDYSGQQSRDSYYR